MNTDAEITRVLAEQVMGWEIDELVGGRRILAFTPHKNPYCLRTHYVDEPIPMWYPLISWADAGMLLDKTRERWRIEVTTRKKG